VRLRKGYLDEAISDFRSATLLDSSNLSYRDNLRLAFEMKSSEQEIIKYLRGALNDRPTDPQLNFRLGFAYAEQGDSQQARQYLMRVIQLAGNGSELQKRAESILSTLQSNEPGK
jgi:tetratricopeptide (TPR) repeat protein